MFKTLNIAHSKFNLCILILEFALEGLLKEFEPVTCRESVPQVALSKHGLLLVNVIRYYPQHLLLH